MYTEFERLIQNLIKIFCGIVVDCSGTAITKGHMAGETVGHCNSSLGFLSFGGISRGHFVRNFFYQRGTCREPQVYPTVRALTSSFFLHWRSIHWEISLHSTHVRGHILQRSIHSTHPSVPN